MQEIKTNDKEALFYDRTLLLNYIREFPQTYQTLLFGVERKTLEIMARRKLNAMCDDGELRKCIIPGTRFGQVMFYGALPESVLRFLIKKINISFRIRRNISSPANLNMPEKYARLRRSG